jgi:precorrin-3B synthase
MSAFEVKGWCPGAWQPMEAGDGLIVRVRPPLCRLTPEQASGIADISTELGNGIIDLTSRSNLQIRGVAGSLHLRVLDRLSSLGLLDDSPHVESRRNVLVTPFWRDGDGTREIAEGLESGLAASSAALPGKFGFAVDPGADRHLAQCSADVRVERGESGGLIVRADGADAGVRVTPSECIEAALALARWFVASGGAAAERGRMAAHLARGAVLPAALAGSERPVDARRQPVPGIFAAGALVGLCFGQMSAATLRVLGGCRAGLRLTPWRMLLVEGLKEIPQDDALITRADDPLLRVVACTGAPGCPQAHAPTRPVARRLATSVADGDLLHVSGCAKGCAHPASAETTLVATPQGFDLVRGGTSRDTPIRRGLDGNALDVCLSSAGGAH